MPPLYSLPVLDGRAFFELRRGQYQRVAARHVHD